MLTEKNKKTDFIIDLINNNKNLAIELIKPFLFKNKKQRKKIKQKYE